MDNTSNPQFALFQGGRCLAQGDLQDVLRRAVAVERAEPQAALVFLDEASGRSRDFDLRGGLDEVLARALPAAAPRGPGRPKLGVACREVSLLPRHWEWLDGQPQGASATLRRLVEEARKHEPDAAQARRVRDAVGVSMAVLAGDAPGFEEALRALYARDGRRFRALVRPWPAGVRGYLVGRLKRAEALEQGTKP